MIAVESADTKKISFNSLTFRDNEQVIAEKIPVQVIPPHIVFEDNFPRKQRNTCQANQTKRPSKLQSCSPQKPKQRRSIFRDGLFISRMSPQKSPEPKSNNKPNNKCQVETQVQTQTTDNDLMLKSRTKAGKNESTKHKTTSRTSHTNMQDSESKDDIDDSKISREIENINRQLIQNRQKLGRGKHVQDTKSIPRVTLSPNRTQQIPINTAYKNVSETLQHKISIANKNLRQSRNQKQWLQNQIEAYEKSQALKRYQTTKSKLQLQRLRRIELLERQNHEIEHLLTQQNNELDNRNQKGEATKQMIFRNELSCFADIHPNGQVLLFDKDQFCAVARVAKEDVSVDQTLDDLLSPLRLYDR